ncbi:MAG: hypothetical protein DCC55_25520 [Chloroflexi bacterium]|nr:MAG: hypothetical protein DCC55_25520 [Chloroflexota bacterium]
MGQTAYDMAQAVMRRPDNQLGQPLEPQAVAMPRRSVAGAIFRFLGWMLLMSFAIAAAVAVTSVWLVSDAARDLFSLDTNVRIVTGQAVIDSIRQVNKQVFLEHYNTVDIDYSEAPEGWLGYLPVRQSFVVLLKGRVPAGFDLSQLRTEDVWVSRDGRRVQLVLPPPVLFAENVSIDVENSRVLTLSDSCPSFLCQDKLVAFKDQMGPQGRDLLMEASLRSGIMGQVANEGQRYYEQFLKSLGFEEVRVLIRQE